MASTWRLVWGFFVMMALVPMGQATLLITNGDFEGGIPDGVHQANVGSPWYDYDNPVNPGNFWENAWQISIDSISPNDTAVLALSAFAADATVDGAGLNGYAYQSIGISEGESELILGFDWGSFDDAPGPRDMGITMSILQSDGTFVPAENTDILGAAGTTLIDQLTQTQLAVPISGIFNEVWTFDLSSATSGQELFLRVNNVDPSPDQAWVFVDNIVVIPEPTTFSLMALVGAGLLLMRRRSAV
jgi:hypothetical protein